MAEDSGIMAEPLSLTPTRTAVLSMDVQMGVVSAYVKDDGFIPRVARLLDLARRAGMRVIHVKVAFRPNVPEASPRNIFLSAVKASTRHQQFFQGDSGAIHSGVAPEADDLIVTKSRVGAFAGTDLDLLLRANDIDTLVLLGIATCGVVLSTAVHAFDADYRVVIVKDCCADTDADLHACLIDRYFPRMASVVTAEEFLAALASLA
jgi:nicotinamidase-related amidase